MKDALKTVLSCSGGVLPDMAYTGMCPHGVLPHKSDGRFSSENFENSSKT